MKLLKCLMMAGALAWCACGGRDTDQTPGRSDSLSAIPADGVQKDTVDLLPPRTTAPLTGEEPQQEPSLANGNQQTSSDQVFDYVEKGPQFSGGASNMTTFISRNLRYPTLEREKGMEGTVLITFVVTKNGTLKDVGVLSSTNSRPNFNKEAIRIVELMPPWVPGEQNGQKVNVRVTIPVTFQIKK